MYPFNVLTVLFCSTGVKAQVLGVKCRLEYWVEMLMSLMESLMELLTESLTAEWGKGMGCEIVCAKSTKSTKHAPPGALGQSHPRWQFSVPLTVAMKEWLRSLVRVLVCEVPSMWALGSALEKTHPK